MHLHVLGLGPVGCLIAHNLRRVLPSQHTITLIHKNAEQRQHLLQKGAIRKEYDGIVESSQGFRHELFTDTENTPALQKRPAPGEDVKTSNDNQINSLLVAIKGQHTLAALQGLAPRLNANSTIVLLQNGMGIYEQMISEVFRNPSHCPHFILASNTHGAFVKHHYHVVHAGMGTIDFGIVGNRTGRDYEAGLRTEGPERRLRLADITGPGDQDAERYTSLRDTVAGLVLMKDLKVSWRSLADTQLLMQRKVAVNAAINPLTALMGCRNRELLDCENGPNLFRQVCEEASAVFQAQWNYEREEGLKRLAKQGVDLSTIEMPIFPEELTAKSLEEYTIHITQLTKGNISSMLQDVRRGRKTEVDFINGYIEQLGREFGVPTPVNKALCDLVKLRWHVPLDQML